MGKGAREIVLDGVGEFRRRNCGGGIYKLTTFSLAHPTLKLVTNWHKVATIKWDSISVKLLVDWPNITKKLIDILTNLTLLY